MPPLIGAGLAGDFEPDHFVIACKRLQGGRMPLSGRIPKLGGIRLSRRRDTSPRWQAIHRGEVHPKFGWTSIKNNIGNWSGDHRDFVGVRPRDTGARGRFALPRGQSATARSAAHPTRTVNTKLWLVRTL